jgi:hypothetical protein
MNQPPRQNARPELPEMSEEELEEDMHAIELPAREAFSLVFSSPTLLHPDRVIEEAIPTDPTPEETA